MMRTFLLLCLLGTVAVAEDTITITYADGQKKSVAVLGFDDQGFDARYGGEETRVAWGELSPESAYLVRKRLTPYDDGAAILSLSEFALGLQLFPEALEQLEIALALGGLDEVRFEERADAIRKAEIAHLRADIDTLVAADAPPQACLEAIKRLKERYPDHEANRAYEPLIEQLVERLATEAQAEQDAAAQAKQDKALATLRAAVAKANERKQKALATADDLVKETDRAIELRQVSRVKRNLVGTFGAERYYKRARKHLREIAQEIDPKGLVIDKKQLAEEYRSIEEKLVDCYLKVARILMDQRNYKGAVEFVKKILLYDPIHEEALEMAEEIRENRINFKLSEITNAGPRVTGG